MTVIGPEKIDRTLIDADSGIGWAMAFIVLAIAAGFGIITFLDQHPILEFKIEKAFQGRHEQPIVLNQSNMPGVRDTIGSAAPVDLDALVDLNDQTSNESKTASAASSDGRHASGYPVRSASSTRYNHIQ